MKVDVFIIGGGITGAGIARDLAMRGVKVFLVEKNDFASGTTGSCMGLLHGGARYLLYEPEITKLSCEEAGYIRKIAEHLTFRVPFLSPIYKGQKYNLNLYDAFFSIYDNYQHLKEGKLHHRLTPEESLKIEPSLNPDLLGAVGYDEWGIDVFRLTLLNILSAKNYGAIVRNHTFIENVTFKDNKWSISLKDIFGEKENVETKFIINSTGPWAKEVCKFFDVELNLRLTKGIHLIFSRRFTNVGINTEAIDGRPIELVPHLNTTLIGCTDDDYFGDLTDVEVSQDDINYLIMPFYKIVKGLKNERILRIMVGVRPLLYETGKNEDKVTRNYKIIEHEVQGDKKGVFTVIGGKMSIYRKMAEDVSNIICEKLGVKTNSKTKLVNLIEDREKINLEEIASKYDIPLFIISRMYKRHGGNIIKVLSLLDKDVQMRNIICSCESILEAELRYSIREEMAVTLDDLRRRLRLGMGQCQGTMCNLKALFILAEEKGYEYKKIMELRKEFVGNRWKGKKYIFKGYNVIQEEFSQNILM